MGKPISFIHMTPQVSIIIPVFNEEAALPTLFDRLNTIIMNSEFSIEVVLVDDGSSDGSPAMIQQIGLRDEHYTCLTLSRNFGQQTAITAGLQYASGIDGAMVIDADLQDPPELLTDFYRIHKESQIDIIYGVRKTRKENLLKRISYKLFYRILRRFANIHIPIDSGDFCFLSRQVIDIMNKMPEESRFLRGMRAWVGFRQQGYEYDREGRHQGKAKYTWGGLFKLAFNGIFNFSEFPVRFITMLGMVSVLTSVIYFLYTIYLKFTAHNVPTGFTAIIFIIILFGGIQLLSISILGEYILRIFYQVKDRPLFIVKHEIREKKTIQ